jgi:hypothetical protein
LVTAGDAGREHPTEGSTGSVVTDGSAAGEGWATDVEDRAASEAEELEVAAVEVAAVEAAPVDVDEQPAQSMTIAAARAAAAPTDRRPRTQIMLSSEAHRTAPGEPCLATLASMTGSWRRR